MACERYPHPALNKRVSDLFEPRGGGYLPGRFRNGGEALNPLQKITLERVFFAGGGALFVSCVNRPDGHGVRGDLDFGGNDELEYKVGVRLMQSSWPLGVGLGKPPGADKHLHVDARGWLNPPQPKASFIETKRCRGPGCSEPVTPDRLRDLAPAYGVAPGGVVERIERTSSNFKEAVKIGALALLGFAGLSLASTILKVRNRG